MLKDKGILVLAEAAVRLPADGTPVRMPLCGAPDTGNPSSLTEADRRELGSSGAVEYWGFREDVAAALASPTIVCLPSHYGEGLPLALAEQLRARVRSSRRTRLAVGIPSSTA
jgi:glycosyltransferase involved in cell wall biosynthesis